MRAARIVLGLMAALLLGFVLIGPRFEAIRAQTEDSAATLLGSSEDEAALRCCSDRSTIAPRQLQFPYYSLKDGLRSALNLVNASPKPLEFAVAIRSRSGQTALLPQMTIQPQAKLALDVGALLLEAGADVAGDFAEGSVAVYFEGTIMPLAGQLTMTDPVRRLSFESEMVDNTPGVGLVPPLLNGLWHGLGGGQDAQVIVSNTAAEPVTADVFLDFGGKRHATTPLVFAPFETKALSVSELLGELEASPAQAPEGGVTIIPRGPKPALVAQGKVINPGRGFSATLNFLDPNVQNASALHASGLPIGTPSADSPYAKLGTFIPHVVVRNLTERPQSVTITVEFPGKEGPERVELAPVTLEGLATKDMSLDPALGLLPLPLAYCSVRIEYSGPPGSTMAEVVSIEQEGDLVIDGRLANEGDGWAGSGANPWHLDGETESIVFLTNMGDRDSRIGFKVAAQGVEYFLTDLVLKARETRAIDIRRLRDAQEADFLGNKIPAGATDGSLLWIRADLVPVMGRMVTLRRNQGMASSYQCTTCCCPAELTPTMTVCHTSIAGSPSNIHQYSAQAQYTSCGQSYWWLTVTNGANWSSSNTAVATISNTSPTKGKATLVAGGTATFTATMSDTNYECEYWNGVCNEYGQTTASRNST